MNVVMTLFANDQRLSPSGCHDSDPIRFLSPPFAPEVFQVSDVVHDAPHACATEFADIGEQSFHEFRPAVVPDRFRGIVKDCLYASLQ